MALYSYRAMNPEGKIVSGNLDAMNPFDLEMRLKRLGLDLIRQDQSARRMLFNRHRIKRPELIAFCFHLEQLMRSGVPIIEALTDLRDTVHNPAFREVIANVVESIGGGLKLSEALAAHPETFSEVFVGLVKAGEQSGQLPEVLARLTENMKWQDELHAQTQKILLYPSFVAVIVIGAIFFLMLYMVPQLAAFIKGMQHELPLQTRILIAVSDFFVHYWGLILALPTLLVVGVLLAARGSARVQYRLDAMKLKLPMVGSVLQKIILARFSTFFAMMYAANINILECLQISEKIAGNRVIDEGLQQVGRHIAEGQGVAEAFQATQLFPPLVLRMLRVGESTGALDTALLNVSYFYDRDVRESIARVQALIEPVLTLLLGSLLGWVILSVLGPIYDVISGIKT